MLKEWTTPDFRNTPSTTNLDEEEIVDALGNDGNASMPEQINRPNPWRKMKMTTTTMMMMMMTELFPCFFLSCKENTKVKPAKTGHGPHSS
jgi:hypothetical protein